VTENIKDAVARRRTFAIIAHPDAGKTTLTEKLLLFGGAIRLAGQVKARGDRRRTQSDWMEIERARGISVSSSVMTFEYEGITYNLLDTPGHQDFSEDTYRTLTAVDSAIMVIDAAKGIESQTRKLLEVCRLRDIPIITFVNKIDREARDPFELLDEIADSLALDVSPVVWPIGMGGVFHGCYDLRKNLLLLPEGARGTPYGKTIQCSSILDPVLDQHIAADVLAEFRSGAELATSAYNPVDAASYNAGHLTPVYFGSALKDFGMTELLHGLADWAPSPRVQPANPRAVAPDEPKVTGFVFKVQANMDPNHRDRVAFMRLCSGRFRRGMKLKQVRGDKVFAVNNPIFFFAHERALAEEALPGDIIGLPNHGVLRVGDTLTEGEKLEFTGIPSFAPEILRRVHLADPIRAKQMRKALADLAEEGVAQLFRPLRIGLDRRRGRRAAARRAEGAAVSRIHAAGRFRNVALFHLPLDFGRRSRRGAALRRGPSRRHRPRSRWRPGVPRPARLFAELRGRALEGDTLHRYQGLPGSRSGLRARRLRLPPPCGEGKGGGARHTRVGRGW
jgi:peptide chain release factor 3